MICRASACGSASARFAYPLPSRGTTRSKPARRPGQIPSNGKGVHWTEARTSAPRELQASAQVYSIQPPPHYVAVVEDGALPGSDGALRLVEPTSTRADRRSARASPRRRRACCGSSPRARTGSGNRRWDPVDVLAKHESRSRSSLRPTVTRCVAARSRSRRAARPSRCRALALPDGEVMHARVLAERAAVVVLISPARCGRLNALLLEIGSMNAA